MTSTVKESDIAVAEKEKTAEPSRYHVIVHNNNDTSYEEVIYIVSKAFDKTEQEAYGIADKVHHNGQGVCGTYSKEIAETKLYLTDMIKDSLVALLPFRAREIKMLKFTMEKA